MKTVKVIFNSLLISFLLLQSCETENESINNSTADNTTNISDGVKKDAQQLVDLQCKVMKLVDKAKNGDDKALMKSEKINDKAEELSKELKEKYTTEREQEEFSQAYEEALGECE